MILNLAAPVGQQGGNYQQTARAEVVTNECCELAFEKDLLGGMMGVYSGGTGAYDDEEDEEDVGTKSGTKKAAATKKRKSKGDDSDDDEADFEENEDRRGSKGGPKAPKISTITNRKRLSKKATKGGKKKVQKTKK